MAHLKNLKQLIPQYRTRSSPFELCLTILLILLFIHYNLQQTLCDAFGRQMRRFTARRTFCCSDYNNNLEQEYLMQDITGSLNIYWPPLEFMNAYQVIIFF